LLTPLEERVGTAEQDIESLRTWFDLKLLEKDAELQGILDRIKEDFDKVILSTSQAERNSEKMPDEPIVGPRTVQWGKKRAELEKKYSKETSPVKEINSPADIFDDK